MDAFRSSRNPYDRRWVLAAMLLVAGFSVGVLGKALPSSPVVYEAVPLAVEETEGDIEAGFVPTILEEAPTDVPVVLPDEASFEELRGLRASCDCTNIGAFLTTFTDDNIFVGDIYEIDASGPDRLLCKIEMQLNVPTTGTQLCFYVYKRNPSISKYEQQLYLPRTFSSQSGLGFYSSGLIDPPLTLTAGGWYAVGVAWGPPMITFGRNSITNPVPLPGTGTLRGRFGVAQACPVNTPLSVSVLTTGAYAQRLCLEPAPGACCLGSTCEFLQEDDCDFLGGQFTEERMACTSGLCPIPEEACCFDDLCIDMTTYHCAALLGTYRGPQRCADGPCTGACCQFDGACTEDVASNGCRALDQVWHSGSACFEVDCLPQGACCKFGGTCEETSAAQCDELPWDWCQGVHCDWIDCPSLVSCPPLGACCLPSGDCQESVPESYCETTLDGAWHEGLACWEVTCPELQACCFYPSGCLNMDVATCQLVGGFAQGTATTCDTIASCSYPDGACCFQGSVCQDDLQADECLAVPGACFSWPGNPCPPPDPIIRYCHDVNTNGEWDECEVGGPDCQPNGVADYLDILGGTSLDVNNNGIPDECEPDCNSNGVPDGQDITIGTSVDCQPDGTPDECELIGNDCNSNSVPDECDITGPTSVDCQPNGTPDECELIGNDCNTNGVLDACDIAELTSHDCQPNGVPDECDIAGATSNDCQVNGTPDECEPDCNANDVPDACDISEGTSEDCQPNGAPDECDISFAISDDCQTNGVPDECDIRDCPPGNPACDDCNVNSVPDFCDIRDCSPGNPDCDDCNTNSVPDSCEPDCNTNGIADECDLLPTEILVQFPLNSNPGWTVQGQWAFGIPTGAGTHNHDPTSGHTGTNVYGYNLSGDYANSIPEYFLTTTAINCSQMTQTELRFWRWVGVDLSSNDHAYVRVSNNGTTWTTVWTHTGAAISESAWSLQSYNISAVADGRPTVYIRWVMGTTNATITYPGWNIDDVEIHGIVPAVSQDCTGNGIPDECEPDCNDNGTADSCDIAGGTSEDCTGNGIPDECEADCNGNGTADSCDIAGATSVDCQPNDVPDECDIAGGTSQDANSNGTPDECDTAQANPISACPPDQAALWRTQKNCIRLWFDGDITAPVPGEVEIRELLAGGGFDPTDLSSQFTFTVENDGGGLPRILKIKENGITVPDLHRKWLGIRNLGGWTLAQQFEVQYVVMMGDVNNDGFVKNADASAIYPHVSAEPVQDCCAWEYDPTDPFDNGRFDLNGDCLVKNADASAVYPRVSPQGKPAKPSGHDSSSGLLCVPGF
ncbi:MAG: hypothetical protein V2A79_06490 [Planctomycetota bacterium]